jgi:DNA-binding XRE family transcriptional regulator
LARSREYYRTHKEEALQYQKQYYAEHRERVNAHKRAYAKRNRGLYGQKQRAIRTSRIALGLTQKEAAKLLGVSPSAVSAWERGLSPCRVEAVLRKLREAMERSAFR